MKLAFDINKYLKIQSEHINERINMFDNKLYLEFGGKLFDDYHASRVLPGFLPDSKIRMLKELKDKTEFIIVVSGHDIQANKVRNDNGYTYESEVLRLIKVFKKYRINTGSIVITMYNPGKSVDAFYTELVNMGYPVYKHYSINEYPYNISYVLSDEGFGKNDFIKTTMPLVVVTAPGPGSGKMATCMSQLYHEYKHGVKAGYAKFETFPIWNLPLKHPVNLAYEAATADLNDINMIDPYHLEAYGVQTVNYNRDIEVFPVLKTMFERIYGECPYKSPTDMGVNMIGECISDNLVAVKASEDEIIRRYFDVLVKNKLGKFPKSSADKIITIMNYLGIDSSLRNCVQAAHEKESKTSKPSFALELPDGKLIRGKETRVLSAPAACLLNALKYLADIPKKIKLLSPIILDPIFELKQNKLLEDNSRLHINEVLIVLSVSQATNPLAQTAIESLDKLKGSQGHSTTMLDYQDEQYLKKLSIDVTEDAVFE